MKVIDNSPIDMPTIGQLVKEKFAVGQLADCYLYVLPSNTSAFVEESRNVFDQLLKSMGEKQLLNRYDFEVLDRMPVLDNHPTLSNAIKDEKCQFVMPLNTPSEAYKQYLLLRTEENKLYNDLALLLYTSERISKHCIYELLRQYALDTPEDFCGNAKETIKSEKFWKNYFISMASDMSHPTFGMRASLPKIREALKIDGIITHQQKSKMMDRMMENIYKYRKNKDQKAEAELNYVLSSLDIESLKLLLIDPTFKADGKYRLFLHKDYDQIQVHFGLRDAFVLYLIYIIDRHERDTVDTLNIKSYRSQFVDLFKAVYGDDGTEERFDKLVEHYDAQGNPQQAQIKHCYSDIRMSVSDGCEKLRELPSPFILSDAQDHLYVLKNKISVPQDLIDMMK